MAYEIEMIVRIEDGDPVPTPQEIEEKLECVIIDYIPTEV